MIVQPDFLTHWKTQMLVSALADPCAPLYVIALWAHCQMSRRDSFPDMTGAKMAAICRFAGDGTKLFQAMKDAQFIEVVGDECVVHDWSKHNQRLVHNWTAGTQGGRPPKPLENPRVSLRKPIREEKIREEKNRSEEPSASLSKSEESRHHKFIRLWCERFKAHFGMDYPFTGGRDGKAVAALVKNESEPIEEIIRTAERAWTIPGFVGQNAAVIHSFHDQRAKIAQALKCQNQHGNGQHQPELPKRRSANEVYGQ